MLHYNSCKRREELKEELQELAVVDGSNFPTFVIVLLVLVLVSSLASYWLSSKQSQKKIGTNGNESFPNVKFTLVSQHPETRTGYLRSLTPKHITLIAVQDQVPKGTLLDFNIPNRQDPTVSRPILRGKVTKSRSLGGSPENWLIEVKLLEKNGVAFTAIMNHLNSPHVSDPLTASLKP